MTMPEVPVLPTLDEDKLQRAVLGEAFAPRLVQRILEVMPRQ